LVDCFHPIPAGTDILVVNPRFIVPTAQGRDKSIRELGIGVEMSIANKDIYRQLCSAKNFDSIPRTVGDFALLPDFTILC
jgi:hypothetical protein